MSKGRNGTCFALKASQELVILDQVAAEHFDRDIAVEVGMVGAVHTRHPAASEGVEDAIPAQHVTL